MTHLWIVKIQGICNEIFLNYKSLIKRVETNKSTGIKVTYN